MATFKRKEGFRFTFDEPISARYIVLVNGKPENLEATKHTCEVIDVSPRGMKMFSYHDIGENNNRLVQLEVQFVLDEVLIKAIGEIVWEKNLGSRTQYGLYFNGQPQIEELIIRELKSRRKKEVSR